MRVTIPNETDVSISGNDPSPVEILAQLTVEIEAVIDDESTVERRVNRTAHDEPVLIFECLDGSQPTVDVFVKDGGLFEIRKYDGHGELPPEAAPDLDTMATLVVRHFRQSNV